MAYASWSVSFNEQPSAAKWNILGTNDAYFDSIVGSGTAWQSYTPTWTATTSGTPSIGNGTIVAKYIQIGKTVFFYHKITWGSTTSGATGDWRFGLPVAQKNTSTNIDPLGQYFAIDTSAEQNYNGGIGIISSTSTFAGFTNSNPINAAIGPTVPFTWATGDILQMQGFYEAA